MCLKCGSDNTIKITGQLSKLHGEYYLPLLPRTDLLSAIGMGSKNNLHFNLCLNCGTIQFPYPKIMPIDKSITDHPIKETDQPLTDTRYGSFFTTLKELSGKVINQNKKLKS